MAETEPGSGQIPRALPPPDPAYGAVERAIGESAGGSVNFNGALLDAVRETGKATYGRLELVRQELTLMHKEVVTLAKSLDPLIQYYKKKVTKWANIEEQFFRDGLKLITTLKGGNLSQVPSSVYEKTKYQNVGVQEREKQSKSEKNEADKKSKTLFQTWNEETLKWRAGLKTVDSYVTTPIRLVDAAFARIGGGFTSIFAGIKQRAQEKAAAEKTNRDKFFKDEEEALKKKEEEKDEQLDQDEYFSRLREVLDSKFPEEEKEEPLTDVTLETLTINELRVESVTIGTLTVGNLILEGVTVPGGGGQEGERNVTPSGEETRLLEALPAGIAGFLTSPEGMGLLEAAPMESSTSYTHDNMPPGISGLLPAPEGMGGPAAVAGQLGGGFSYEVVPEEGSGGMGAAGGPGIVPPEENPAVQEDQEASLKDILDSFLGEVRDFFDSPENSEVGRFLTKLVTGSGEDKHGGSVNTMKIELPPWVEGIMMILAIGGIAALLLIAGGVFIISKAIADVLEYLKGPVGFILHEVGEILKDIAGFLGFILETAGWLAGKVAYLVDHLLEALVNTVIDFINDPGAFIEKLADGLGGAIETLITHISRAVGEAFKDIPILATIAKTIDRVATNITDVTGAISGGLVSIIQKVSGMLGTVSSLAEGILAILGGAILVGIANLVGEFSGFMAFMKSFMSKDHFMDVKTANKASDEAYATSQGEVAAIVKAGSDVVAQHDKQVAAVIDKAGNAILYNGQQRNAGAASGAFDATMGRSSNMPGATSPGGNTNTNNTVVNQMPSFAGIPIYGGGF